MSERSLTDVLEDLLQQYRLGRDELDATALRLAEAQLARGDSAQVEEVLRRVVRMAATNRELRRAGLQPLSWTAADTDEEEEEEEAVQLGRAAEAARALSDEERSAIEAVGISSAEYELTLRGQFGTLLGLRLTERAFNAARAGCRTKRALACCGDEEAARTYLREWLRGYVRRTIARRINPPSRTSKKKKKPRTYVDDGDEP